MFSYADAVLKCWPVFLEATRQRRTLSYSELAGRAGPPLHHRHIHRQVLVPLARLCRENDLPDLSALVVRASTGLPGGGWFDPEHPEPGLAHWAAEVLRCHDFKWPKSPPKRLLVVGSTKEKKEPHK